MNRCRSFFEIVFCLSLILVQVHVDAWADTLEMIDGAMIHGEILERNPHFILIKTDKSFYDGQLRLYFHNIKKVNGEEPIENLMSTAPRDVMETNDKFAITVIKDISNALEAYARAHNGAYPVNFDAMREADPHFRLPNQCGRQKSGYRFFCTFNANGYVLTAEPLQLNISGSRSWSIQTGSANNID